MRMNMLVVVCSLAALTVGAAQQPTSEPAKVSMAGGQTYQQLSKEVSDERGRLRADARQAFNAEMKHETASFCAYASSTYDWNICLARENAATEDNYKTYAEAVRAILGLKEPLFPESAEKIPASQDAGPGQPVAEFDKSQRAWESYRDAECSAAFHQFGGGTGGPGAEMECKLHMTRAHMRDLDYVYDVVLYH